MEKEKKINIIVTAQMGKGTFEAKIVPLSKLDMISNIYVLRKSPGPKINKVHYLIIPKIFHYSFFKLFIPIILARKAKKYHCKLILAYHFIPHAFYAYIASTISGIPFNISQTGSYIHKYFERKPYKWLIKKCMHKALFVNVPGFQAYRKWVHAGINAEKINFLHSTIDTTIFKNTFLEEKYDLIFIGRLNYVKRIDLIIQSVKSIIEKTNQEIKLAIVGSGEEEIKLKELCSNLNLKKNIDFLGFRNDTSKLLNQSKIFVMYSSSEGLPVALMEAMACEKTVIAPDVGNIKSLITHGYNGFIVNANDKNELIEKIILALHNHKSLQDMRTNARNEIIKNHSIESAIKKWKKILNNIDFEKI